jgi:hypothetical protein
MAIGVALWVFACVGYAGVFSLVRGRFGVAAGVLAGTMLLVAAYVRNELYLRGDFSEFSGMMMLAAALAALVGWLEDGGRRRWVVLALTAGAVVVCHPVAGLSGYATLAATIVVWAIATRSLRRPLVATSALVAGVGLAAFYWLPIWLEWGLVQGDRATKADQVARSFLTPFMLLGLEPSLRILPAALGRRMLAALGVACGLIAWRWRHLTASQRRLVVVLVVLALGSSFMTTWLSSPIWEAVPLLALVQFPWRLLLVQTVVLAALAGCVPGVPRAVVLLGVAVVAWPLVRLQAAPALRYTPYSVAFQLERVYFAPDVADEWLPAGARRMPPRATWRAPALTAGTLFNFRRTTGWLHATISSEGPSVVTMPHYYFGAGWSATLDGEPVPMAPNPIGLMVVGVPHGGTLDVRFGMTPARRAGLAISGTTLALVAWGRRPFPTPAGRRRRGTARGRDRHERLQRCRLSRAGWARRGAHPAASRADRGLAGATRPRR